MSSRTAAGRKRLQQPKPQKPSSFKSPFKKNSSSDAKSPSSPPSLPSSLSGPIQAQAPYRQPYNLSDTSDAEDFSLVSSRIASQPRSDTQWRRTDSNALDSRGSGEIVSRPTRAPPSSYTAPNSSRAYNPYPSPPQSAEDIYSRSRSSDSSMGTVLLDRAPSPSPFLIQTEPRSGQAPLRYGSAPTSMLSIAASSSSSHSKTANHGLHAHGYPSPPDSNADPLSPLSLSPVSAAHSTLPSLISESSSDSASTRSFGVGSSTSLAVNTPASIFSSSSGSSGELERPSPSPNRSNPGFIYPSSRSVGRPSPGGPKFKFKNRKNKGTGMDAIPDEGDYNAQSSSYRIPTRATSAGLRLSMIGPSSISTPSLRSPHSFGSRGSSSGSSLKSSDPGFVFPTARSRAHPNAGPRKFKQKKKLSSNFETEVDRSAQKFMGISLNRKKKSSSKAPQFPAIPESSQYNGSVEQNNPDTPTPTAAEFGELYSPEHDNEPPVRIPSKLGIYPLDPYDSALLDSDKATYNLLRRLNSTDTPSFCHFGNDPPSSVLDLGSGQGHWILEAAIHWKGYGTQFTGVDIADTMKVLRPLAVKNGVAENIKFVRSNFLKQPLPFPDQSFDLIRMANLTYSISYDKWEYVLGEVCRVLTIGGRLELIDDHIFFPYGKPVPSPSPTTAIQQGERPSPQELDDSQTYNNIYGADDDGDVSDTATLNGNRARRGSSSNARLPSRPSPTVAPTSTSTVAVPNVEFQYWSEQVDASQELESLFEHMMNFRFGIHLCPSEFIQEMLSQIFGHSREVRTMHLTIAHPDARPISPSNAFPTTDLKGRPSETTQPTTSSTPGSSSRTRGETGNDDLFELSPGLVLWPSTLLPMSHTELQAHALKHPRTLLSSKAALSEYASETLDIDTEDDTFLEAMWEYESFMSSRLNPPMPTIMNTLSMPLSSSSSTSVNTERGSRNGNRRVESDHISVYSLSSVTSDTRSAMWDYDFELRHHFAWPMEDSQSVRPGSAQTMRPQESYSTSPPGRSTPISHEHIDTHERTRPQSFISETHTIASDLPSFTSHEPVSGSSQRRESMAPPDYSATEPTHVRTFHVYEAIKMDPALFAPN
ncbi:hypothetical protein F5878DRAFT_317395 [Lentinula raphanica]|uniref:Methyltransferase domain-containing protein n=1 Tax=Lentinula raphanica TaxID=153919 RepID=A0AA38UEM9_9AGAR|nr:hypothetical protein F5880DRAFT_1607530 [Lentinula raphanica]KAJ3835247.1 hypothetical protein F5878DRAFT_317395 [Lentinula raphanica]